MRFALAGIPEVVHALLARSRRSLVEYDLVVMHRASLLLHERLGHKLVLPVEKCPMRLADCGNTVSSTIPLVLESLLDGGRARRRSLLVGFGVGLSWAACEIRS